MVEARQTAVRNPIPSELESPKCLRVGIFVEAALTPRAGWSLKSGMALLCNLSGTTAAVGCVSIIYSLDTAHIPLGVVGEVFGRLPLYAEGFGWVGVAVIALMLSVVLHSVGGALSKKK